LLSRLYPPALAVAQIPATATVRVRLLSRRCLDARRVKIDRRRGACWWWLRRDDAPPGEETFIRHVALPRGDQPIDVWCLLAPGRYTLGTGRGPDAIRVRFRVLPEKVTRERKCLE
jgi:hypothetical protein